MSDSSPPPDDRSATWSRLVAGRRALHAGGGEVPDHRPVAAVLGCADARVPPDLLFDCGPGELFTVRVAGASATPAAVASLDYAVAALGVPLIVVLGHTPCGAAQAAHERAVAGGDPASDPFDPILAPFSISAGDLARHSVDELVVAHVAGTVETLRGHAGATGMASRDGRVEIVGAVYDVAQDALSTLP